MFVPSKFNICYFQAFQVSNVIKEKYQHNSKQHHFVSKIYCNGLNKHAINIHGKVRPTKKLLNEDRLSNSLSLKLERHSNTLVRLHSSEH